MNHISNACAPTVTILDIPRSLEELSSHLYGLEERIIALQDRLKPLTIVRDEKTTPGGEGICKASSVVAETVDGYSDRVRLANYKLERLLNELQI